MILSVSILFTAFIAAPLKFEVVLDQKPLALQEIHLVGFKAGKPQLDKKIKTDVAGKAHIDIDPKLQMNILAQTIYQNIAYNSGVLNSASLPKEVIRLTVYPAVEFEPAVHIEDIRLFMTETNDGIKVDQEIVLNNPSKKTVAGKPSSNPEEPPESFRFQLPKGAFDMKFDSGFSQETTRFENNDIILARPLLPGRTHLALQYSLERGRTSLDFQQEFSSPVSQISLGSVNSGLRIRGLEFKEGPQKWVDDGPSYIWSHHFEKAPLKIRFSIGGWGFRYRPAEVIAPLTLLLLLALLFLLKGRPIEASSSPSKPDIEEWTRIHQLQKQNLISADEAYHRKMKCLEKLIPQMNNQVRRGGAS